LVSAAGRDSHHGEIPRCNMAEAYIGLRCAALSIVTNSSPTLKMLVLDEVVFFAYRYV